MSIPNAGRTPILHALPLAALMLLSACAHGGPPGGFDRGGPQQQGYSEKAVIRALAQVEADDFRAAQAAGKADQQHCPIPHAA